MSASLLSQFEIFSRYNRLANLRIVEACRQLSGAALVRDRGEGCGSIIGALNHVLIVDRVWLDRFTRADPDAVAQDDILYFDLDDFAAARAAEDARIEEFVESLSIAFLSTRFQYRNRAGDIKQYPTDLLVAHMFNRQTHHRGEIQGMLCRAGATVPVLDMHQVVMP